MKEFKQILLREHTFPKRYKFQHPYDTIIGRPRKSGNERPHEGSGPMQYKTLFRRVYTSQWHDDAYVPP